jgi:hypothetical protein
MPLALVKDYNGLLKWKTIDDGCAYDCAPHKVQIKQTHCQTIVIIDSVSVNDNHKCMYGYLRDRES